MKIIVFASGNGSTFDSIVQYQKRQTSYTVSALLVDNADCLAIQRAIDLGISVFIIDKKNSVSKADFENKLRAVVESMDIDLIVLAGFMTILSGQFVQYFYNAIINIHPSLLPRYKGLHTYQRVLDAKEKKHGCTVHYVTAEIDAGEIIEQQWLYIDKNDTVSSLEDKTKRLEQRLYPQVIEKMAVGFNSAESL